MLGDKCQAFMEDKPLMWPDCVQESGWLGQIPTAASARRGRHLERWAQETESVCHQGQIRGVWQDRPSNPSSGRLREHDTARG